MNRLTDRLRKLIADYWLVIIVLTIAGVLRLWNLSSIPPHLTPDEAALGYNAYSILKTGRDEYGQFLPIIFKSFGDYKPGLYVYLTVPFVAVFGLSEFAVRLPSALAGAISVWLIYLVVKSLFTNHKSLATISAFVLAINPWSIYFSRGAWEVNVSLALTLAGIYFFLKSLEKQKFLILSAIFFGLTLLTYQGAKLSTAIVFFILSVAFWKEFRGRFLRDNLSTVVQSMVLGLIIVSPIIISTFQGKTGRLEVFSVFSYARPKEYLQGFLDQGSERVGDLSYYLFHPETLNFARGILGRWFNHFSGRFLFFEGDWPNPRHSAPNQGMLLFSDLVLLVLGFVALTKLGVKKEALFVWLWLFLAPLPSVLSRDQVHAVRALNTVIPLVLIQAFGMVKILNFSLIHSNLKGGNTIPPAGWNRFAPFGILTLSVFGAFYLGSFIYFLDAYFIHLPKHNSKYWEYGYKQIVQRVSSIQPKYKTIKVQQSFAQPYIYFLFHQKYDPIKYQKEATLVESEYKGDVGYIERLDNICFCPIDWSVNRGEKGILFVADSIRIPEEDSSDPELFNVIKEIKYLNGRDTAFRIIEVK